MNDGPNREVEQVFLSYPPAIRSRLYQLRDLILSTAASVEAVGPVTETLRWGEPAYLTEQSGSGSTIRIGWKPSTPGQCAIYFNCRTKLVDTFRTLFPELAFEGNRALLLDAGERIPRKTLAACVELALTYHLWKKGGFDHSRLRLARRHGRK